jgi:nitroimidazol reductase NimA-like FMN-containing flavoprotein (pyridoxamine 5'-phosphate oxidase superfamily)
VTEGPAGQIDWQELTKSECFALLSGERLGRVAVVDDQGPIVFPVNFVLDRNMVVFRTDEGTKLDAAARGSRVAFEIDGTDEAARSGWSVLIRGEATEVTDPAELARLRKLRVSPWAPGAKTHFVRILPAKLTGRRIWAPGSPPHRDTTRNPGTAARSRR